MCGIINRKTKDKVEVKGILVIADTRLHHRKPVLTIIIIIECKTEINYHIIKPLFFFLAFTVELNLA